VEASTGNASRDAMETVSYVAYSRRESAKVAGWSAA
jgi:hypothetical protein